MMDRLFLSNGYSDRVLAQLKKKKKRRRKVDTKKQTRDTVSTLKIPHLTDQCTAQIRRAAEVHQIPVRIVTTPGRKLKHILTSSRPLDEAKCPNNNCVTCQSLDGKGKCTDSNLIYGMGCDFNTCKEVPIGKYEGETYRPIDNRSTEHYRSAKNPTAESYKHMPFAKTLCYSSSRL